VFLVVASALFSCDQNKSGIRSYLNEKNLPSQIFSINTETDNTLITKGGCVIKIPKGSLESLTANIKLEVKEALTNTDIVLAGLNTMSGVKPLSSGGMIFINAVKGFEVKIKKQLEVLIPTKAFNNNMQVFKGKQDAAGKIDWIEPAPLPTNETSLEIKQGESLFKANCANCHKIKEDFTGPSLYGITYRKSKKWLADFTRNPAGMISFDFFSDSSHKFQYDYYSMCLFNKYQPIVMPAFPNLKDKDLENLYGYIKSETDKEPPINNNYGYTCCDSCYLYKNEIDAMLNLENNRHKLAEDNGLLYNLDRKIQLTNTNIIRPAPIESEKEKEYVAPVTTSATFYSINISTFGWYNVDIFMKEYSNCVPSELFVSIQSSGKVDFNVNLIIPSHKVFVEGGKLKDGEQYGFDETSGKIPLPIGANCYIIAFAEYDGKILFGKSEFAAKQSQTINLKVGEITKEELSKQINGLNLDDVKVEVKDSENANEIKALDKKNDSLKNLLPKNCNCIPPMAGTVPIANSSTLLANTS